MKEPNLAFLSLMFPVNVQMMEHKHISARKKAFPEMTIEENKVQICFFQKKIIFSTIFSMLDEKMKDLF